LTSIARNAHYRAQIDDTAHTLAQHHRLDGLGEVEHRLKIHGDHHIPLLLGHAHQQRVARNPGIVHQNIHTAKIGDHLFHHLLGIRKQGSIGGIAFGLDTQRLQSSFRSTELIVHRQIRKSHVGSFAGKFQGNGLANSAGRTGNQSGLSI